MPRASPGYELLLTLAIYSAVESELQGQCPKSWAAERSGQIETQAPLASAEVLPWGAMLCPTQHPSSTSAARSLLLFLVA